MNYFELFEIPEQLIVDKRSLQQKYFELQKKYHPDFYSNSGDNEQDEMLERSSEINKAYKTFQNNDETIKYVLQLKGLLEEEEKYELPHDFLMEMMELNETLMEDSLDNHGQKIHQLEEQLFEKVNDLIENYTSETPAEQLLEVKDYYYKKKYLNRILERLEGMRKIAPR